MSVNKWGVTPIEAYALEELERLIGKPIPVGGEVRWDMVKLKIDGGSVVKLVLNHNKDLTTLPESFGQLESLQEINLYANNLISLPESFGRLKSLQILYLTSNQLTTLPASFGNLTSLKKLQLSNNQLMTLPESFSNLKSLEELNLHNNKFTTFPESVGRLKSLQKLDLSNNQLTSLPETFEQLQTLQKLDLADNKFTKFPESLDKLKTLNILDMSANKFKKIESFGNLSSLQTLILDRNELTALPETFDQLKSLQFLNVKMNKLISLPESFSQLESLQTLDLSNNQLTSLPESFGKLKSLQKLELWENQLTTLPESFWRLEKLYDLSVAYNPWKEDFKQLLKRNMTVDGTIANVQSFLKQLREMMTIHLFISHREGEFHKYHVKALAEYLAQQVEIYPEVFYSEKYLVGDLEDSMERNIEHSHIILFIASHQSVFESEACQFELATARKLGKVIIPLKGEDITWNELEAQGLTDDKGLLLDLEHFDTFCIELYTYLKQYKLNIGQFETSELRINKQIQSLNEAFQKYFDSSEFMTRVRTQPGTIEEFERFLKKYKNT